LFKGKRFKNSDNYCRHKTVCLLKYPFKCFFVVDNKLAPIDSFFTTLTC
jgi:uncharacterized Zn-finger protein